MDLASRLAELEKRTVQHREVLLTEEAAKTALVMPFLQALGYDVFDPAEVVPEFTADVGTKRGEKVDYAVCANGKVSMLIECKPASVELCVSHASQLFRYFSVTDARVAVLTNGVVYNFYSDLDQTNRMDERPFFTFRMDGVRKNDARVLQRFAKGSFDLASIKEEAGQLKYLSLVRAELEREFATPSDEFVRLIAKRVQPGLFTSSVREQFTSLVSQALTGIMRDMVSARLTTALKVADPTEPQSDDMVESESDEAVVTTEDEQSGYRIIQAMASRYVDPKRITMRDSKSYCAILLDDNNRKSVARLRFNGLATKYVGTLRGKEETKHQISDLTDIYQLEAAITERLRELIGARSEAA